MNSFDYLMDSLTKDSFRNNTVYRPISETEFQQFLKEAVFGKLKGKKLGVLFQEKFDIPDRTLSMFSEDKDVISHIRYCKYVK